MKQIVSRVKSILIVDDSLIVMHSLIPLLETIDGIEIVIHVPTYREALEMLAVIRPDLIMLDICLPDKSGIELLQKIRQKDREVLVIMVSNDAIPEYRAVCQKLGAQYFIDKSKEFDLIPELIAQES